MLIVVSSPTAIENEAILINSLFDEGMELFHLRKPDVVEKEVKELLEKIEPRYYSKIALHQYHELADEFKIKRLHFTEEKRKATSEEALINYKKMNYILSTSVHTLKEYENSSSQFEYVFFGPVFNSISKKGYSSAIASDFVFSVDCNRPKVIAIGGIEVDTIKKTMKMNFNGVAVLGTIWQEPKKSILQFKEIKKVWNQLGQ